MNNLEYKADNDYQAVPYNPEKHQQMILDWLQQWNINPKLIDIFPPTGFIVPDVCCMFIYETNSKLAFLDEFISNRQADEELRNRCLDRVTEMMLSYAKFRGYSKVIANTKYQAVVDRSKKFGFFQVEGTYQTIVRNIWAEF